MMPRAIGRWMMGSKTLDRFVGKVTRNGMIINTTGIYGFTLLRMLVAMRPMRPRSLRFDREQRAIDAWLDAVVDLAGEDYALAAEVAKLPRVLKGYGQTHAHGVESFTIIMDLVPALRGRDDAAATIARLTQASLADEDGAALAAALKTLPIAA